MPSQYNTERSGALAVADQWDMLTNLLHPSFLEEQTTLLSLVQGLHAVSPFHFVTDVTVLHYECIHTVSDVWIDP